MAKPLTRIVTTITFTLFSLCCLAQDSLHHYFSEEFKADTNGNFGTRQHFKPYVFNNEKTYVKGINIGGYTKEQVLSLLGMPNNSTEGKYTRKKSFSFDYYLSPVIKAKKTYRYVLLLTFEKGVVINVSEFEEELE